MFPGSVARTAFLTIQTSRITGVATGLTSIKTMSFVRSKELGAMPEILKIKGDRSKGRGDGDGCSSGAEQSRLEMFALEKVTWRYARMKLCKIAFRPESP